jgi:hypothetical protein
MKRKLLLPILLLVLAGCATTPAERINRNPSAFGSWPPEVRVVVRAGKVAIGFTPDQVRMALGDPDRVITRTTDQGPSEVWVYHGHGPMITVGVGIMGGGGSTRVGGATEVSSGGRDSGDLLRVSFKDGRVSAVEQRTR